MREKLKRREKYGGIGKHLGMGARTDRDGEVGGSAAGVGGSDLQASAPGAPGRIEVDEHQLLRPDCREETSLVQLRRYLRARKRLYLLILQPPSPLSSPPICHELLRSLPPPPLARPLVRPPSPSPPLLSSPFLSSSSD